MRQLIQNPAPCYSLFQISIEQTERGLRQGFGAGLFWGGSGSGNFRLRLLVKENMILEFLKTDYKVSKIHVPVHVGHILSLLLKRHQMMLSSIKFSWIIKQIIKVEPEPGQSDGSGSSQIPRLRASPTPKPWLGGGEIGGWWGGNGKGINSYPEHWPVWWIWIRKFLVNLDSRFFHQYQTYPITGSDKNFKSLFIFKLEKKKIYFMYLIKSAI